MNTLPFSLLLLAWHSPRTLRNTLTSYKDNGLLSLTDDVVIFFQEVNDQDIAIAEEFGITKILSSDTNIGIGPAIVELVKAAKHEHFLFCEEDWHLGQPKELVQDQIEIGLYLLTQNAVDVVKMRSRYNPGSPLYTLQFKGREVDCPEHWGESIHWIEDPDLVYPKVFSLVEGLCEQPGEEWYVIRSKHVAQTNNPCLHSKRFYTEHIAPFSGQGNELEGKIREYWQSSNFIVAHSLGLFTHLRFDR